MTVPGISSTVYYIHPKLMTFGFVYGFITSVALVLVPRFRNVDPTDQKYLKMSTLIVYQIGVLLSSVWPPHSIPWALGYIIMLSSTSLIAYYIVRLLYRSYGPLAAADPLISLSSSLIPFTILLTMVGELRGYSSFAQAGILLLILYGVAGSMIFGIGIKTTHFRIELKVRRRLWKLLFPLLGLSASVSSLAFLFDDLTLELAASASYATSSVLWIYSTDGLRRVKGGGQFNKMNERDRVRYLYFSAVFVIGCIWLIAGSLTSLLATVFSSFRDPVSYGLRDAFIHSVGVGFVGNMIIAYAPILLPGILSARMPYQGLSLYPVLLLNSGNLLRVVWFVIGSPMLVGVVLLSVALYLSSTLLILVMMHQLR